ncbi:MAG: hypothetical protein QW549_00130 [Candidatus Micrarchaeaceae archaeon]
MRLTKRSSNAEMRRKHEEYLKELERRRNDELWNRFLNEQNADSEMPHQESKNSKPTLNELLKDRLELLDELDAINKKLEENKEKIVEMINNNNLWNDKGSFSAPINGRTIYVVKSSKISVDKIAEKEFVSANIGNIPVSVLSIDFTSLRKAAAEGSAEAKSILDNAAASGVFGVKEMIVIKVYGKNSKELREDGNIQLKQEKRD